MSAPSARHPEVGGVAPSGATVAAVDRLRRGLGAVVWARALLLGAVAAMGLLILLRLALVAGVPAGYLPSPLTTWLAVAAGSAGGARPALARRSPGPRSRRAVGGGARPACVRAGHRRGAAAGGRAGAARAATARRALVHPGRARGPARTAAGRPGGRGARRRARPHARSIGAAPGADGRAGHGCGRGRRSPSGDVRRRRRGDRGGAPAGLLRASRAHRARSGERLRARRQRRAAERADDGRPGGARRRGEAGGEPRRRRLVGRPDDARAPGSGPPRRRWGRPSDPPHAGDRFGAGGDHVALGAGHRTPRARRRHRPVRRGA